MYVSHRALNNQMARVVFLEWLKTFHFESNYIFDQAFNSYRWIFFNNQYFSINAFAMSLGGMLKSSGAFSKIFG